MKFEVRNSWTGRVQFSADLECHDDSPLRVKIGLAVKWAFKTREVLRGADLRGADLRGAVLTDADLRGVDLRGADLGGVDLRGAVLRGAILTDAVLRGAVLRGAVLRGVNLRGVNLRGADLRGAVLTDADLTGADLRGVDLTEFPKIKNIHQTVFAVASQPNALDMRDWHTCDTTHCRAGWVTTLAGKAGRDLELKIGTPAAATLIYLASDPSLGKAPDFYCGYLDALADMKRLAEIEAARNKLDDQPRLNTYVSEKQK